MKRIAPTERVRKQIEELLIGSVKSEQKEGVAGQFIRLAVQRLVQELLEAERTDALGREPYERKSDTRSWRNGYEPKTWRTSEGKVPYRLRCRRFEARRHRFSPGFFRPWGLEPTFWNDWRWRCMRGDSRHGTSRIPLCRRPESVCCRGAA